MVNGKSHLTAITRRVPSKPAKILNKLDIIKGRVLDYGCGKGFDADHYGWEKYDPHYFDSLPNNKFNTIVCTYVLNVLTNDEIADTLRRMKGKLKVGGSIYISVRRDITKPGFRSRGTLQRNIFLPFDIIYKDNSLCIYQTFKGD